MSSFENMKVKPVITLRTAVGLHALNEYFKDDEAHCYQKLIPLAVGHNICCLLYTSDAADERK